MKLFFLSALTAFVLQFAVAQITITQADMPSNNDTIRYSNAAITNLNFVATNTGPNYNWDFSRLNMTSQDIYAYKSSFLTPYLLYFFNTVGLKTADSIGVSTIQLKNIYTFYTKNATVFRAEGQGYSYNNVPLANDYIDADEVYQFPLLYRDRDSSHFYFDYQLAQLTQFINYAQSGDRINEADGWGSITTPYKTYPDVLRVKSTVTIHDSIKVAGFPINTTRIEVSYKWLSKTEKIPVLEISGVVLNGNYTVTSVRFRDAFRKPVVSSNAEIAAQNVKMFPNPATNNLTVQLENAAAQRLSVFNSTGQLVLDKTIFSLQNIDIQSFASGVYFVKVGEHIPQKIVVSK